MYITHSQEDFEVLHPSGCGSCGKVLSILLFPCSLPLPWPLFAEVNLAAAVIAVLSLTAMALGCLSVIMVLSKGAEVLLRLGAVCFGLSGEG